MDISSFVAPVILDREALAEFSDALTDRSFEIERNIARLRSAPNDRETIANLFRSMHNIKGDAALCRFELGVLIAHPIESLMSRFREGEIGFSEILAELILLSVDRLELAVECLLAGKPLDNLQITALIQGLNEASGEASQHLDQRCVKVIESVTGFRPILEDIANHSRSHSSTLGGQTSLNSDADLQFFRTLALQFESRSPLFKGRTMRILRLALETNKAGDQSILPAQLEAAVYLHDVGMMFLSEAIWLKVAKMTNEDRIALRNHPGFAAGLLQRMPGWESAAEIVAQHHEMPDGGGYPNGLNNHQTCAGAKILAIVDAFEAVMLKHIHRGKNRSVLRAIAEINACDNQFAPEWIAPFNAVIRKTLENS